MKLKKITPSVTELHVHDVIVLFSYERPVACKVGDKFYKTEKGWSKITKKQITLWLRSYNAESIVEEVTQEFFHSLLIHERRGR